MEILLDANALRKVADILTGYTARQAAVLDEYRTRMEALGGEWRDDETFSELYHTVCALQKELAVLMESVAGTASFFRARADAIDERPAFRSETIRVARPPRTPARSSAPGSAPLKRRARVKSLTSKLTPQDGEKLLMAYLDDHEYSADDYDEYSQDPEWRGLMALAFPDAILPPYKGKCAVDKYMINDLYAAKADVRTLKRLLEKYDKANPPQKTGEKDPHREFLTSMLSEAEIKLTAVRRGQPYRLEKESDFWDTPDGRKSCELLKTLVSLAAVLFDEIHDRSLPMTIMGESLKMLSEWINCRGPEFWKTLDEKRKAFFEAAVEKYDPPAVRIARQIFFLRDENGNPLTSAEAERRAKLNEEQGAAPSSTNKKSPCHKEKSKSSE